MPFTAFMRTDQCLEALEEALIMHQGDMKAACRFLGCGIRDVTHWQQADPEAAKRIREAQQLGWATLESVAWDRAVNGVEQPIYHNGFLVGHKREYSDSLLGKMLAARVPGYGDKAPLGSNLTVNVAVMPRASTYE